MKFLDELLTRWGLEDTAHHKVFRWVLGISIVSLLVSVVFNPSINLLSILLSPDVNWTSLQAWGADTAQGVGTEMIGALGTFLLVERIMDKQRESRAKEEQLERLKREKRNMLLHDLTGDSNTLAGRAIEEMRRSLWIVDGTLQNVNLHGARMNNAQLSRANLENVRLVEAYLNNANLFEANLVNVNLSKADLEKADLNDADLRGASLRKCRMRNARLNGTHFSTSTILPDGNKWSAETDMEMFTDPNHPEYYDPCAFDNQLWYCSD